MIPVSVSIIDENGLPIVMIPEKEEMNLLSGVISAILEVSREVSKDEIEFVKTKNRVIFLKHIGGRGYLLLAFSDVDDPKEVSWVVILFINELKKYIEATYEFVSDLLISAVKKVYDTIIIDLGDIYEKFKKIKKYHSVMKKVIGLEADEMLKKCSSNLLVVINDKVLFNSLLIKNKYMGVDEIKDRINNCEKVFMSMIKKFL